MVMRVQTANDRLREEREKQPGRRLQDVAHELEAIFKPLGVRGCSTGTLQRYETNTPVERMSAWVLFGLTIVYDCPPRDLVPERADDIEAIKELVRRSPGCTTGEGVPLAAQHFLTTSAA